MSVLAIDRAGSGDVHAVEIHFSEDATREAIPKLTRLPAHDRWLAFFADNRSAAAPLRVEDLYPEEAPGRLGLIEIFRTEKDDLEAKIQVKAERFRAFLYPQADVFVAATPQPISSYAEL